MKLIMIRKDIKCIVLLLFAIGLADKIFAKDLFVAPNGSDTITYSQNDINNPWATPQKAWYNAQAGDIVYFRAGTYTISGQIDAGTNGHDGTSSAWIEFTRYGSESVTIKGTGGTLQSMFKIGKDYNYIHHLNFDADGNSRVFMVGYDTPTVTGFRIEHCTLEDWANGDNCSALYLGSTYASATAKQIVVRNCIINGRSTANYQNYCGIQTFGVSGFTIENNEISYVVHGIYLKHSTIEYTNHGSTVRYNWIHDQQTSSTGAHKGAIDICENYVTVSHNICHHGINIGENAQAGGSPNGNYNTIEHNTSRSYGCTLIGDNGSNYNTIRNNIFASRTTLGTGNVWDYNMYISGSAIGAHDLGNTSPAFVGGSLPTSIDGFALITDSNGENVASDGTDIGADVSIVGTGSVGIGTTIQSDSTPPTQPNGVNVQIIN